MNPVKQTEYAHDEESSTCQKTIHFQLSTAITYMSRCLYIQCDTTLTRQSSTNASGDQ